MRPVFRSPGLILPQMLQSSCASGRLDYLDNLSELYDSVIPRHYHLCVFDGVSLVRRLHRRHPPRGAGHPILTSESNNFTSS